MFHSKLLDMTVASVWERDVAKVLTIIKKEADIAKMHVLTAELSVYEMYPVVRIKKEEGTVPGVFPLLGAPLDAMLSCRDLLCFIFVP